MGSLAQILFLTPVLAFILGCSHGHCVNKSKTALIDNNGEVAAMKPISEMDKVKIYKWDGSLQCNQGQPIKPEVMQAQELQGITVFQAQNLNDGKMRIQKCGAPTGQCNVFTIERKNLDVALKKGFKEWIE